MIIYKQGDILLEKAEALVNTVNCEGYMGKGIAYKFKCKFPENNADYQKACKSKALAIGKLHYFKENGQWIINFPTKDKWREDSRLEYIEKGMAELIKLIRELGIKSIAIPPLGCGNGGLNWNDVLKIVSKHIKPLLEEVDFVVYEPFLTESFMNGKDTVSEAPKLTISHYFLILIKSRLKKFNKTRLQKAAFFMNYFSKQDFFKFDGYLYGPYAHSIEILAKQIKEYQEYYKIKSSEAAKNLKATLISNQTHGKMEFFEPFIVKAADLVDSLTAEHDLELYSSICYLVNKSKSASAKEIFDSLQKWSPEKAGKFSRQDVEAAINVLADKGILTAELMTVSVPEQFMLKAM
ncbi:MAG: macro domain-containing protein [Candidatus Wallbacteria bacterium]|nr:macro domain-containing protein [Candidatus Wallbacteria bacterium]